MVYHPTKTYRHYTYRRKPLTCSPILAICSSKS
uniref:Uncharacterized protein n=1 Tax=Podoviridae sp. ctsNK10 TaxID=2826582 RepID=A0A8S5NKL7_9CAUD|nr:MAG TPA: hypothetical protein [Podoviridae sp. ctsNK10]